MYKIILISTVNLLFLTLLYSQTYDSRLTPLLERYKSFDYHSVIEYAENLLKDSISLSASDLCEIYRLKAISHYSLLEMPEALNNFIALLKINPDYTLDPVHNSPKIIAYFNEIQRTFLEKTERNKSILHTINDMKEQQDTLKLQPTGAKKSMVYSLLVPGLGHITSKPSTKGWLLVSAGMVSIAFSTYYVIDTQQKERDYLNATDKVEIEQKYSAYNAAYKKRNIALFTFASIWLYSQIDYIFFSQSQSKRNNTLSFRINMTPNCDNMLTLRVQF